MNIATNEYNVYDQFGSGVPTLFQTNQLVFPLYPITQDHRDAEDAIRGLDGTRINGSIVKVEMSKGVTKRGGGRSGGGGSYDRRDDRGGDRYGDRYGDRDRFDGRRDDRRGGEKGRPTGVSCVSCVCVRHMCVSATCVCVSVFLSATELIIPGGL